MENWTSGHSLSEVVGKRASCLNAGYSDGGGWSMAQKAIESAKLVAVFIDCCSKAQNVATGRT
jgi:hypothetical protein